MASNTKARLGRLEETLKPATRQFVVWGGVDGVDAEAEKQRLRQERGPIRDEEFLVVSWLSSEG